MLVYPNIDPVLLRIGAFQIRWYGICYLVSIIFGYFLFSKVLENRGVKISKSEYEDLSFYIVLGIIFGGRIGYVLFYNLSYYFYYPIKIFAIWQGGMSFHGGLLGVMLASYIFLKKHNYNFSKFADAFIPFAAVGFGLGRIGNFINGELYGRVTQVPWGMIFPTGGSIPRHPSQIYEFLLEGVLLGIISLFLLQKIKTDGLPFWIFFGFYGFFRTIVEHFRQPDGHIGFIFWGITMGQVLSILMMLTSIYCIYRIMKKTDLKSLQVEE